MPNDANVSGLIAARHAEVLGWSPRIGPVERSVAAAEVQETTRELIAAISGRGDIPPPPVDSIPEIMFTLCRFPELWQAVMNVTKPLQGPASVLPPRDRKLAILRTGWLCQAPYEFGEHVAQARRMGFTAEEIEAIIAGSEAPEWEDHERAILAAVEELHANSMVSDATWSQLAGRFDDHQMFELLVLVGQFTATAYFQNSLRLRLEADNAGLSTR